MKMNDKLSREIAILEAEAAMIEAHAAKLLKAPAHSPESVQHQELLALAEEEAQKAAAIRSKISALRRAAA